jgi:hypothetical protein
LTETTAIRKDEIMALLLFEGFEGIHTTEGTSVRTTVTDELSRKMTVRRVAASEPYLRGGQLSGKALSAGEGGFGDAVIVAMGIGQNVFNVQCVVGFRIKLRNHTTGGLQHEVAKIYATRITSGERQLELVIDYNDANKLSIRRQGTVIETEASGTLLSNTWHYIEWKFVIHNTAGSYTVRIDDTQVLNGTSLDTQGTGGGAGTIGEQAHYLAFQGADGLGTGVDAEFLFDDIYMLDSTGSINNDFRGANTRVVLHFPDEDGVTNAWTPQTGTDHFEMVNEVPPSSTDYNDGGTINNVDEYRFPTVTQTTIYGVKIESHVRTDAGGRERTFRHRARNGASTNNGAAIPVTGDDIVNEIFEVDPDTSAAWTASGLNVTEFGVEVTD